MKSGANNFTSDKVAKLRKNIDFSDIPEIKDMSGFQLKNWKPVKKLYLSELIWIIQLGLKAKEKKDIKSV